jgi:hypothetical protein
MLNKNREEKVINIDIMIKDTKDIIQQFGCTTLNREFEDYIFNSAKNYALDKKITFIIHIPKEEKDSDLIKHTIHKHFSYKVKEISLQLNQQLYQWIINMIIGILFLVLCLILVEVLEVFSHINIIKIIKESLLIIGWVALWEPVSFILFGWRIKKRDKLFCEKLSSIPVSFVYYQF